MPQFDLQNRDLHDDTRNQVWDGLWQQAPSGAAHDEAGATDGHMQDGGGSFGATQGLDQIGLPEDATTQAQSPAGQQSDATAPASLRGDQADTNSHAGEPIAAEQAATGAGATPPLASSEPAAASLQSGQQAGTPPGAGSQGAGPQGAGQAGGGGTAPAAAQEQAVADAPQQGCNSNQPEAPEAADAAGPILYDGESGGGLLGMFSEVLENAMDIVSGLIDLVQAQIQSFFEGLEGAVDAVMSFATTFSFNYWDGDSIESVSFTANAVAAYDAETGNGEYAASVSFAGAGATEGQDGDVDSYAVSIGYAEAGAFGSDEDGLFEHSSSSALSVGAAVDDGEESLSFLHNASSSETVTLPAEQGSDLDGLGNLDELAEGLSMAEANSQAGTSITIGEGSIDAAAGAGGIGLNLEYDGNGVLIDSGAAGVESSAEVHIDDLDTLFGAPDAPAQPQPGSLPGQDAGASA